MGAAAPGPGTGQGPLEMGAEEGGTRPLAHCDREAMRLWSYLQGAKVKRKVVRGHLSLSLLQDMEVTPTA